jgi:hypothetical protein
MRIAVMISAGILGVAHLTTGAAVAADCITLVADLAGAVAVADTAAAKPKDRWPVQLLQCLPVRKVVALDPGARATLFFPAGTRSFELVGPGRYQIVRDGILPLNGSAPAVERVLNQAFQDVRLDRSMLSPAGVRMRTVAGERLTLLEPRGIVTDPARLSFRWQRSAERSGELRFRLANENGEVIHEAIADGEQLVLPDTVVLAPGLRFFWHVEDTSSSQRASPRWERFVIATEEVQALARQIDSHTRMPSAAESNLRDLLLMQSMAAQH